MLKEFQESHFNVCVKLLEASDLPHPNISSLACVQVGSAKKYTKTIKNTNKPRFDEYFVFDLRTTFAKLMSTVITVSLFEPKKSFRFKTLIGCISLEVSTLWALEGRRLKRWLAINLPSDVTAENKGFVKCEINIEASEQLTRAPLFTPVDMPNIIGGITGKYMVRIYQGLGLETGYFDDTKRTPDVLVKVSFAGRSESTTPRLLCENPTWNEQISFIELLPPLYQKITIEIKVDKSVLATKDLFLNKISYISKKDGFYPTYGPSYINLYKNDYLYQGSLLMAVDTELIRLFKYKEHLHAVLRNPVQPVPENRLLQIETFLLLGVVFDVIITDKQPSNRKFQIELHFGKRVTHTHPNCNTATKKLSLHGNSDLQYISLKEKKPCLFLQSDWPDIRYQLSNSNVIGGLLYYLRERVDYAKDLFARGGTKEASDILKAAIRHVKTEVKEIPEQLTRGITKFDLERIKLKTIYCNKLSSTTVKENDVDSLIEKSYLFMSILEEMCDDLQESIPNIFLSVKDEKAVIGYCKVHPKEILFSRSDVKRGMYSGKIVSLPLEKARHNRVGQLNIWLWLGLWSDVSLCLQSLPPGHDDISKALSLPLFLTYSSSQKYAAVCHILRGNIVDEDNKGLCDPFVRVLLSHHSIHTKTVKKTLTPQWKETLTLSEVILYPNPTYLADDPPVLTVELFDGTDRLPKLIGTTCIKPRVRLQPEINQTNYSFKWYSIGNSQILAFFELIQLSSDRTSRGSFVESKLNQIISEFKDPPVLEYRLEVVFWGIRGSDTSGLKDIIQPQAIIQCGSVEIKSEFVVRANTSFNFKHEPHIVKLELPETKLYTPPLVVRLSTSAKYFGSNVETNIYKHLYNLPTEKQWNNLCTHRKSVVDRARSRHLSIHESMPDLIPLLEQKPNKQSQILNTKELSSFHKTFLSRILHFDTLLHFLKSLFQRFDKTSDTEFEVEEDEEEFDWWYRYISNEVKIYKSRLEDVKEFRKFNDILKTFSITQKNQDGKEVSANVKAMICLYRWPSKVSVVTRQGQDPEMGVLKYIDLKERVKLLIRVYCIKAYNLHPADPNGSADPFIELCTQSTVFSDSKNHINQQLNPVFGRCLEVNAEFPLDTLLAVRVMDYDRITAHDLIGETIIDLENRFYSKHRATCGLSSSYSKGGYDAWRDVEKPVSILEKLCNSHSIPLPQYYDKSVVVASKEFVLSKKGKKKHENQEKLALQALRRWNEIPIIGCHLVPEHIETRPIYNKKTPGIEQGKLEMWVDIFDLSLGEVPPPIDISPRKPQPYELRVVVWNTAKIPLVDSSFFVGKKHTDILVKGWLWDSSSVQSTDVHYTSINGSGNFNWRFIFPFLYLRAEKQMVIFKKNIFEISKVEHKCPAILTLQVWDKDRVTANDFIGALEIELCRMPRPARSYKFFKDQDALDPSKTVDLFRVKHLKGWWPFSKVKNGTNSSRAGFVEAEFHLLTADEAVASPAGMGRSEPSALPPPLRPTFKVKFWLAPFRMLVYLLCGVHKGKFLLCLLASVVVLFLIVGFYSIPMFLMKRIIGA